MVMTDDFHVTLTILRQGVREAMKANDPDAAISSFLSQIARLVEARQAFIFDDQSIYPYSYLEKESQAVPYTFSPHETYCAEIINRLLTPGEVLVVEDVQQSAILDIYTKRHFACCHVHNFLALGLHLADKHSAIITLENLPLKKIDTGRDILRGMELFLQLMLKGRDDFYKLRNNSFIDQMTGVYNRNAFNAYLHNIKRNRSLGVMFADINNLKQTNDREGHASGDQLIRDAASILRSHSHGGEMFRLGGDEFLIVWQNIGRKTFFALGQQLRRHLREQNVDISLGFYWAPMAGTDINTILRAADERMYDEKRRNHEKRRELLMDDSHFEKALENGEFSIYIQPIINIQSGRVCGGEVLVRYLHDGILLEPDEFLPAMRTTPFIFTLDKYVWEQACRLQRRLIDWGLPSLPLSVNVSARDFYLDDVAQVFTDLLKKYNLSSNLIFLEIKEQDYRDNSLVYEKVTQLTKKGIIVIIDDFGENFNSLRSLEKSNLCGVKTQARFSLDEADEYAMAFFNSVLNMTKRNNIFLIAKGIEKESQALRLKKQECPAGQGNYWYRPLDKAAFVRLISQPEKVCAMADSMLPYGIIGTLTVRSLMIERILTDDQISEIIGPMATLSVEKKTGHIELQQVNQAFSRLLYLSRADGLQRSITDFPTDKEGETFLMALRRSEDQAHSGYFTSFTYHSPTGKERHLAGKIYPIARNNKYHHYFMLLHPYRK